MSINPIESLYDDRMSTGVVPNKVPDWMIIMTVYSMVIVTILLISNVTPNGKLYIHFTAFWSMIIYFILVIQYSKLSRFEP